MKPNSNAIGAILGLLTACGVSSLPPSPPRTALGEASAASPRRSPSTAAPMPTESELARAVPDSAFASSTPPTTSRPAEQPGIDTSLFLANIEVTRDPTLEPSELRLIARVADGPFGDLTRRGLAGEVRAGRIAVRLPDGYPTINDPITRQYRTCSYVIDCDSKVIASLGVPELSPHPSRSELVRFTSGYISTKSLSRGFDIASEVAMSHEGDCSEHAVLLAALARRHRSPARVVFGFAVIRFAHRLPMLVGHAWTEIHDGHAWNLADAALADAGVEHLAGFSGLSYLPIQVLSREDAGFRAKLLAEPGSWQVEKAEGNFQSSATNPKP